MIALIYLQGPPEVPGCVRRTTVPLGLVNILCVHHIPYSGEISAVEILAGEMGQWENFSPCDRGEDGAWLAFLWSTN